MKLILLLFFMLSLKSGAPHASEFQLLEGQVAYNLYLTLPGVRCVEWNSSDLLVYTKYQTSSCNEEASADQWTCTVQINKKDPSKKFESASCSREVL